MILFILVIIVVAVFLENAREKRLLKTTTYSIDAHGKISGCIKLCVLTDLHNCIHEKEERLYTAVKDGKPDIILLAGDMLVGDDRHIDDNKKTAGFINRLGKIAEVYYSMGNHETSLDENYEEAYLGEYLSLLDNNIKVLRNDAEVIEQSNNSLCITGIELPGGYYKRFNKNKPAARELSEYVGISPEHYNILLAHNPDFFDSYVEYGADLIISGHNHGGMARLPFVGGIMSPRPDLFPKYDSGVYFKDDTAMVVSRGLGGHSVMPRFNNIPELIFVTLS